MGREPDAQTTKITNTLDRHGPEATTQRRYGHDLTADYRAVLMGDPCVYCGEPNSEGLDHIWPASRRGDDGWTNRAPACRTCDQIKGAAPLLFFLVARQRAEFRASRRHYRTRQHQQSAARSMLFSACEQFYRGNIKWLR